MRAPALIAVMFALAAPAFAQDNTPRSPADAEQERRINGPGFEQLQRQNPSAYQYAPPAPSAPAWTPQYGVAGPNPANPALGAGLRPQPQPQAQPPLPQPRIQGPRPAPSPMDSLPAPTDEKPLPVPQ